MGLCRNPFILSLNYVQVPGFLQQVVQAFLSPLLGILPEAAP